MDEWYATWIWFHCEKLHLELTEIPKNKVSIGSKWVHKFKFNFDGRIEKFKARLVAKGYLEKEGIDYDDTFEPIAKMNSIILMISLTTKNNWDLHKMDINSTFLNGELK